MTDPGQQPEVIRERMSQLIRYEMQSLPTASLGRIKRLDEESRRAAVELHPDGTTEDNVPVATPFARPGHGDITPLNPETADDPVFGIVLYLHHPIEEQLAAGGGVYSETREHEDDNCIFLPAQIWFDGESVPDHDPDERLIDHPSGTSVTLSDEGADLTHESATVRVVTEPEPEYEADPIKPDVHDPAEEYGEEFVEPDTSNREWPLAEESGDVAAQIEASGTSLTATERGVALEGEDAKFATGALNDGNRRPLAGPHQHFHLVDHGHNEFSLAGPQLEFREFIAWMTDSTRQSRLRNAHRYKEARGYAENYLAWLEDELGRSVDPTDPEDWPEPEPMPTPAELEAIADVEWGTTITPGDAWEVMGARRDMSVRTENPVAVATPAATTVADGESPVKSLAVPPASVTATAHVPSVASDSP